MDVREWQSSLSLSHSLSLARALSLSHVLSLSRARSLSHVGILELGNQRSIHCSGEGEGQAAGRDSTDGRGTISTCSSTSISTSWWACFFAALRGVSVCHSQACVCLRLALKLALKLVLVREQ